MRRFLTCALGLLLLARPALAQDPVPLPGKAIFLGGGPDPEALLAEGLNQAAGFLRSGLFKRLHIHTVPTLHFVYDRTTEKAADMNALIAKAVSSRVKED